MNRLIIYQNEKVSDSGDVYEVVDQYKITHLREILKINSGDTIKVTLIGGGIGHAFVQKIDNKKITLKVLSLKKEDFTPINLMIGLSRPPTIKKILEHGTTLGASSFHFYKAKLSEKSYLQSKVFEKATTQKLLELGVSQSGIFWNLPNVETYTFPPTKNIKASAQNFVLSLNEKKTLLDFSENIDWNIPINMAFGPERGFTKEEEDQFIDAHFLPISLGQSILRVEHAVFSTLSQIELLRSQARRENT